MPAVTFFCLLKAGRRVHAYHLAEQCDIAAVSTCEPKYQKYLKDRYLMLAEDPDLEDAMLELVPEPATLDSAKPESAAFLIGLFGGVKGRIH